MIEKSLSDEIEFTESHTITDAVEFVHPALKEEIIRVEKVKEAVRRLKEELESDKYTDYEYPAHQSFIKINESCEDDEDVISKIIDKIFGQELSQ